MIACLPDHLRRSGSGCVLVVRLVYFGAFLGGKMCDWQMPAMSDGHEAKAKTQRRSSHSRDVVREAEPITDDDDGGTSERSNGVKVRTQHLWNLGQKNIARHTTADPG